MYMCVRVVYMCDMGVNYVPVYVLGVVVYMCVMGVNYVPVYVC